MYAAVVHKKLDTKNLTRTGRPKKITAHGTRQLKNIVKSNRTKTLESLTNLFNSGKDDQVSSKTVARTLHSLGFRARKACRKAMISKKNLKKRLEFYNKYKHWSSVDWNNVIFSEESKFNLVYNDGRVRVWRQPGERFDYSCTSKTVHSGGGSVMFWSCISNNTLGPLIEVNTRLYSSKYISNILVPFLQTFWKNFMRRKPQAKFMQDNAPCHKSKKVLSWFGSKKVSILDWPPQSPDLNPIENLWAILFSAVREKHEQKIDTLQELRVAIREEWQKIPKEILQRLYASIPLRLKEMKKAKGNATKY